MAIPVAEQAKQVILYQDKELLTGLKYIPQDRRNWSPGGVAKTAMQIFLECASIYGVSAKVIRHEPVDFATDMLKAEDYPDMASAQSALEQKRADLFAALDSLAEADLSVKRKLPWGEEMELGVFIWLPSYHTAYHAGQLNYIQTLLGDKEMHAE